MKSSTCIYQAFEAQMTRHLCNPSTLYVGYSGGLDSSCLLHMAWQFCQTHSQHTLQAIHVQHGLQQVAHSWPVHCKRICDKLRIPYLCVDVSKHINAPGNLEANARKARWQAFETAVKKDGLLLLGHHLDDQIETFFLRILRAGGLQGMRAIHTLKHYKHFLVLRPLLDFKKSDLSHYAKQHDLTWKEDPSNQTNTFDRNWLRNLWLPALQTRWPHYQQSLHTLHKNIASDYNALQSCIADLLDGATRKIVQKNALCANALNQYTLDQQKAMLRQWLAMHSWYNPSAEQLHTFLLQVRSHRKDKSPTLIGDGWVLLAQRNHVFLLDKRLLRPTLTIQEVSADHCGSIETHAWVLRWRLQKKHSSCKDAFGVTTTPTQWLQSIQHSSKRYKKQLQYYNIPAWARCIMPHVFRVKNNQPTQWLGIGPVAIETHHECPFLWDFVWKS